MNKARKESSIYQKLVMCTNDLPVVIKTHLLALITDCSGSHFLKAVSMLEWAE